LIRAQAPSSVHVLLDRNAAEVVSRQLEYSLQAVNLPFDVQAWTPSEAKKSLAQAEKVAGRMLRKGADRSSLVLGVGGGITTDLAGFVAANLMRGCAWGAIPTTLLGMADAAIGGKTAVNLAEGKNLFGAFHQPSLVLADVSTLRSLAPRDWSCGLGEIVKAGMICKPALLKHLENCPKASLRRAGDDMLKAVRMSMRMKLGIVSADPREGGERKLLNLGHTFGHALETLAGPRKLAHGEAVALGILCALYAAVELDLASPDYARRIEKLLTRCGLPTRFPGKLPSVAMLAKQIARDKKKAGSQIDWIVPIRAGKCRIVPGTEAKALATWAHARLSAH